MKKGKYYIEKVIYVDRNITPTLKGHIPYHLCTVVVGPKGGRYLLDTFCTEYTLKSMIKKLGINVDVYSAIRKMVHNKSIGYTATDLKDVTATAEQLIREVGKQLNAKPLLRLEGKAVLDSTLLQNFYVDDLKAIQ